MKLESPKKRRHKSKKRAGIALAVFALLIAGGLSYATWSNSTHEQLDPDTLCPSTSGPSSYWAVIIDGTDSYSRIQWQDIQNHFNRIKGSVPKHGMLAVYTVPENPSKALNPRIELCNPGSGENLDIWTGNPELARRRWNREFDAPIDSIFRSLDQSGSLQRSPIIETVTAINVASEETLTRFPNVGSSSIERRLYIVSDMLQHTERYSHYSGEKPSFDRLRDMSFYDRLKTDLSGWKVSILYALRDQSRAKSIQGMDHLEFWNEFFFRAAGVIGKSDFKVLRIEG